VRSSAPVFDQAGRHLTDDHKDHKATHYRYFRYEYS
jgi:hypothetical protein